MLARTGWLAFACALGCLAAVCWRSGGGRGVAGEKPPAPGAVTVLRDLPYRAGPSKRWRLDLAVPKGAGGKPRPAVVVIHGGGWLEGDKSSFASRAHGTPGNIEDFAALGFVAATINYRLSGEAPFPAALEDCKCAVRWLRAHAAEYNLDPQRVGAYGNSAGGHLALLLGLVGKDAGLEGDGPHAEQSSAVQAVVSDSGPLDLLRQHRHGALRRVVEQFLGGPPEGKRAALYKSASPAHRGLMHLSDACGDLALGSQAFRIVPSTRMPSSTSRCLAFRASSRVVLAARITRMAASANCPKTRASER